VALNIDELRTQARRRLPIAVFDFIDGAAEDEVTLRRNREAFARHALVPRVGIDVGAIDPSTTILGQPLAVPLILAPTGLCGMATSRGEIPAARAAGEARIVCAVSCLSSVTLEEVVREAPGATGSSSTSGRTARSPRRWSSAPARTAIGCSSSLSTFRSSGSASATSATARPSLPESRCATPSTRCAGRAGCGPSGAGRASHSPTSRRPIRRWA
jgi:isopentenyl diphosphate isomerase/L-lactate dehydrogenase-like FMN-dependent dehydrogenase